MSTLVQFYQKFSFLQLSILLCFLLPPAGIFLLLLIGLRTIYKQRREKKRFVFSLSSYFFLCLFISSIGASISMKEISYLSTSIMILGYWGLYIRVLETEKNQLFQQFQSIVIFGGVYSCVVGWISKWYSFPLPISYLTGTVLFGKDVPKDYDRLIGCAYNPNFTVYILLIALSFMFANLLSNLRRKQFLILVWQLPILLLLSYGVIQTGSRAGFASMILITLLFMFRISRIFFILSTITCLVLSKWLLDLMPRAESVFEASQVRQDIWKGAFQIWQEHSFFGVTPIGFGQEYIKHYNEFIPHAHNIIIGTFVEFGIFGGLIFLILFGVNLVKSIHLFFSIRSKKYSLDSFLLSLPIIFFTGIFDEPLFSPQIGFLTIILFACWDRYMKRIQSVVEFPAISTINGARFVYMYLHQRIKHNYLHYFSNFFLSISI